MIEENGTIVFQKKDYVFADGLGVCKVEEVTNLATKNGTPTQYYGLKSIQNATTAYFPVVGHEIVIRRLIDIEEAQKIVNLSEDEKKEMDSLLLFEAEFIVKQEKKNK